MFLLTQIIGLFVISVYLAPSNMIPYGMEPPKEVQENFSIWSLFLAFAIAIGLFFLLTKINAERIIRYWFFLVTILALGLAVKAFFLFRLDDITITPLGIPISLYSLGITFLIALPLAYIKIFKRHLLVHNLTELLIYPGIAIIFVPLLNFVQIILLLLAISLYDIWAVWHSGFMQKMAKYQINNLKIFTGFFVPYADRKQKLKIKQIKQKYAKKSEEVLEKQFKKAKIKVNLAILGGGDIIFPIITAGIFFKLTGLISAAIISTSATLALLLLFTLARKGRFYPAMPFLSIGMYLGMIVNWFLISIGII